MDGNCILLEIIDVVMVDIEFKSLDVLVFFL